MRREERFGSMARKAKVPMLVQICVISPTEAWSVFTGGGASISRLGEYPNECRPSVVLGRNDRGLSPLRFRFNSVDFWLHHGSNQAMD